MGIGPSGLPSIALHREACSLIVAKAAMFS
jgi:hypothetical protein